MPNTTTKPGVSRLMTTQQAWEFCGVGEEFFRKAVGRREIAIHHIGRAHRFTAEDLNAWLNSLREPPARDETERE